MTTDIYNIDDAASVTQALDGLARAGRFEKMDEAALARLQKLASALVKISEGLDLVTATQLWMETSPQRPGVATLRLKVACVVDLSDEDDLKELSSTGKNTERKGLLAKIKGVFEEYAIAENEDMKLGAPILPPDAGFEAYPVAWAWQPAPQWGDALQDWNGEAAADVKRLAARVDVGYSSSEMQIAATMRYEAVPA